MGPPTAAGAPGGEWVRARERETAESHSSGARRHSRAHFTNALVSLARTYTQAFTGLNVRGHTPAAGFAGIGTADWGMHVLWDNATITAST